MFLGVLKLGDDDLIIIGYVKNRLRFRNYFVNLEIESCLVLI